jgi:hypothetical protein
MFWAVIAMLNRGMKEEAEGEETAENSDTDT